MQTSLPGEQPQPNQEFYGLEALLLVKTYTRDSYRSAGNGTRCLTPLVPNRTGGQHIRREIGSHILQRGSIAADGAATIVQITQDAKAMATPNFKGLPQYPAWAPPPTAAVQPRAAGASATPVDPNDLSTPEQAQELFLELGGTRVVDTGASSVTLPGIGEIVFPISFPAGDSRRAFAIVLADGKIANVGQALVEKYGAGVGHPGHWTRCARAD